MPGNCLNVLLTCYAIPILHQLQFCQIAIKDSYRLSITPCPVTPQGHSQGRLRNWFSNQSSAISLSYICKARAISVVHVPVLNRFWSYLDYTIIWCHKELVNSNYRTGRATSYSKWIFPRPSCWNNISTIWDLNISKQYVTTRKYSNIHLEDTKQLCSCAKPLYVLELSAACDQNQHGSDGSLQGVTLPNHVKVARIN